MLTLLVRLSLLAELSAYAVVGAWAHARLGCTLAQLLAAAVAFPLAVRLALVAFTCLQGWIHRAPRAPAHRLGLVGTIRMVVGEYLALLADNFVYLPFESAVLRPDPTPAPGGRVPVILVHGYLSNRGYFRPMARWLEARATGQFFAPNFRSVFSTIEHFAAELHAEIERIAAGTGQPRVILVCHSMGGLAARKYLQEHGAGRVARLVTIASPHHGTVMARLGIGPHARQMRRESDFLRALAQAEAASPPQLPATSIYTTHDNLVAPQDTSRLAWGRNVALAGVGHVNILTSARTFPLVLEEIKAGGA